ncbi:MAG: hypothetical protein J0H74_12115 [Chitinophagaceae bacterium]|nr:hypothetical protein [Chitinophagaceae bacterium]
MNKIVVLLITWQICIAGALRAQLNVNNTILYIPGGDYVSVQKDVISNVNIQGTGKLLLNGKFGQVINMGGNKLYSMDINDTAGVKLASNMAADGIVSFINGIFDLQSYVLDLGSAGGTLNGETNGSRITATTGTVDKTAVFNGPNLFNPGDLGLVITSSASMGTLTIKRGHQQQTSANGGLSIHRYYDISPPAGNSGLNATFNFSYFDGELAGRTKSELTLWTSEDNGLSWNNLGVDNNDPVKDQVTKNGIPHFSRFTLASPVNNPLPLMLLGFSGIRMNGVDILKWQTADEQNTRLFEVEYSTDGSGFSSVGSVLAMGSGSHIYSFTHPAAGPAYYRLKMIDMDDHFTYSKVIALSGGQNIRASQLQPNPAYAGTQLVIGDNRLLGTQALLFDGAGGLIRMITISYQQQDVDVSSLAEGIYYIKLQNGEVLTLVKK